MKLISQATFSIFVINVLCSVGLCQNLVYDGSVPGGLLTGPDFLVPQNAGVTAGGNLLHSFAQFNVGTGESVTFTGAGVSNILARVTGGETSRINGFIRSDIAGANLFLLNPAGVMIGEGARLDVSGSFNVSTADYLKLADGREFRSSMSGDLTLMSAAPEAFGFLSNTSGGNVVIEKPSIDEVITFPSGQLFRAGLLDAGREDMRFVARNVRIEDAALVTRGGDITIAAQGTVQGEVLLTDPGIGSGEVMIKESTVNVGWTDGGRILVRGAHILIEGEKVTQSVVLDSGQVIDRSADGLSADGRGVGQAGELDLRASDRIEISNTRVHATGRDDSSGGSIYLEAGSEIRVTGGSVVSAGIDSYPGAKGDSGEIIIRGGGLVVDGLSSAALTHIHANTSSHSLGDAGFVDVSVEQDVSLLNGGNITANSFGSGNAGRVTVNAKELAIRGGNSNSFTGIFAGALLDTGDGSGGMVNVNIAGDAAISNRGWIGAVTDGSGDAGSILFRADNLTIRGAEDLGLYDNEFLTGIIGIPFSGTDAQGRGAAIDVRVADTLRLERGGQIDSSTFGGGDAGNVYVEAGTILADRGGSRFFTGIGSDTDAGVGAGNAGDVTVHTNKIELRDGAHISSSTFGFGDAGDIFVSADKIILSGSGVGSDFVPAQESGIIALTKSDSVGSGGDITVTSPCVVIDNGGLISAQSDGNGDGGLVAIEAGIGTVDVINGGRVSARSQLEGVSGGVMIRAGRIQVANGGVIDSLNTGSAQAGTVRLEATLGMGVEDGTIAVSALNADAGQLELILGGDLIVQNGLLTADAGADGGGLLIQGGRLVLLKDTETRAEAAGDGGNISVLNGQYLVMDRSRVSANAINGDGGVIDLQTGVFFSNASTITAISQFGNDGTVQINPDISLANSEVEMDVVPLDKSDELQPECTQRLATKEGSFTQAGRGGSQRLPGGYLPSLRILR